MKHRLFIESRTFTRLLGDYLADDEYAELQQHLLDRPTAVPKIRSSIYRNGEVDTIPGPVLRQIKEAMEDG